MLIIGIDPGKEGALVALHPNGNVDSVWKLQDGLDWILNTRPKDCHVFVEKAQAMTLSGGRKGGAKSMFVYGTGFGEILGILRALMMRHTLIPPATWTKSMHLGTAAGHAKMRSLEAVKRLFPMEDLTFGKAIKPHEGIIDALLIAEFGRRNLG